MTKRFLALVLVCILAIPIFALPVSATTTDTVKIDTTQYNGLINNILSVSDWCKKLYQWAIGFDDELFPILNNNHTELGEWLGTMGADMRDGLLVIGTACVDIYDYLVNVIFESIAIIQDTLVNFAVLVDEWLEGCFDYLELIYNSIKSNFTTLFGEYLTSIKNNVSDISGKLSDIINGSEDDKAAAEDFQDQVATESTEMQEALDQIQQATIPDYEGIDTDFKGYFKGVGILYPSTIYEIFRSSLIKMIFVLAFTFSMLTYIFFGKR